MLILFHKTSSLVHPLLNVEQNVSRACNLVRFGEQSEFLLTPVKISEQKRRIGNLRKSLIKCACLFCFFLYIPSSCFIGEFALYRSSCVQHPIHIHVRLDNLRTSSVGCWAFYRAKWTSSRIVQTSAGPYLKQQVRLCVYNNSTFGEKCIDDLNDDMSNGIG